MNLEILNNQELNKTKDKEVKYLEDAFSSLFKANMGGTYARGYEESFSGDAASLFTLISSKNEDGKEELNLMKVAWGEFSKETFTSGKYPAFENFPHDLFCVSQSKSYLADKEVLDLMKKDPIKYLKENSLFSVKKGVFQKAEKIDHRKSNLNMDIKAVNSTEMLKSVRNQIIELESNSNEFTQFLKNLPDNLGELAYYIRYLDKKVEWKNNQELEALSEPEKKEQREKYLMEVLLGMGIETVGVLVGEKKAIESIINLKKEFNFTTNSF